MANQQDKRKQSLYFPEDMLEEIQREATRQDRSLSWIVQQAWKLARERVASIPGVNGPATTVSSPAAPLISPATPLS
jgi:uncharacterized small protein (TIGR04563 family)